jgi:glycosyltransferase involved in cell wall biosynthesis
MRLSILIPVYNEKTTISEIVEKVLKADVDAEKEIIIVDDGSTDGTREIIKEIAKRGGCKSLYHDKNKGKGAALRTGFKEVSGDVIVVQDADLEYAPSDWKEMFRLVKENKADVVFGSRFYGRPHRVLFFYHYLGNKIITSIFNMLFNLNLTDVETGYKMFKSRILKEINLSCNDFGFEIEFAAKAAKRGYRIYETGIGYYGRTYAEGKKIKWMDGIKALFYIVRFRIAD